MSHNDGSGGNSRLIGSMGAVHTWVTVFSKLGRVSAMAAY